MKTRFFFVIFASFLLLCLFMNKSISEYLQQKYHIHFFPESEFFNEANALKSKLEAIKEVFVKDDFKDKNSNENGVNLRQNSQENSQNLTLNSQRNSQNPRLNLEQNSRNFGVNLRQNSQNKNNANSQNFQAQNNPQSPENSANKTILAKTNILSNKQNFQQNSQQNSRQDLSQNSQPNSPKNSRNLMQRLNDLNAKLNTNQNPANPHLQGDLEILKVEKDDEFLLIGDSMMQSVGLALSKDLRALGIRSNNLAKQSTGLAYKSTFNWAQQLENALAANPKIRYLAVLLGANDTWDISTRTARYSFFSEEWCEFYGARVVELVQIAQKHGVRVFWYEVPAVKKDDLNAKIQLINGLFEEKIHENNEIFVRVGASLGLKAGEYSAYIKGENNRSLKVRADDGVHFNPRGAKIMSKLLLAHLRAENE